MATLESLYPTIQTALTDYGKGIVGFAGGVPIDASTSERVAKGQTIQMLEPEVGATGDATPGASGPRTGTLSADPRSVVIEKVRNIPIPITGDQMLGLRGNIYPFMQKAIKNAIRKLVDEMDEYLAEKALFGASRVVAANFGSVAGFAEITKQFQLNKINAIGRAHLVLSPDGLATISSLSDVGNADKFGSDELSRQGKIGMVRGYSLHTMLKPASLNHVTNTNYVVDGDHAAGVTSLKIKSGSGALTAGMGVGIGSSPTTHYVTLNDVTTSGTLQLNKPGLMAAAANGTAVAAFSTKTTPEIAYIPEAIYMALRPPAVPDGGDTAVDSQIFRDDVSGLMFEVALYKQYMREVLDVRIAYGAKVVDSEGVLAVRFTS